MCLYVKIIEREPGEKKGEAGFTLSLMSILCPGVRHGSALPWLLILFLVVIVDDDDDDDAFFYCFDFSAVRGALDIASSA